MSKLATIPGFVRVGGRLLKKSDIVMIDTIGDIYSIRITLSGKQDPVEIETERLGDFIKKMKREDEE